MGGPIFSLALDLVLFSRGVEYQSLVASPSEVVNAARYEFATTPSPSEMGKEVVAGWGIIPGMLFLVLWGYTLGVARISLGCVGLVDVGWSGREY